MNEKQIADYNSAKATLAASGIVISTFEEMCQDSELMRLGENRGVRFTFLENERLTIPDKDEVLVFTTSFTGRDKKTYKVIKVLVISDRRGPISVPVAAFSCAPYLVEEQERLYDDNDLGRQLAAQQPDLQRVALIVGHTVQVTYKSHTDEYHTDYWKQEDGERVHVEDALDLPHRKNLQCYKFCFV
jgi:hypothetical protein